MLTRPVGLLGLVLSLLTVGTGKVSAQIHQAGQTTLELSAGALDGFKLPGKDNFGYFSALAYGRYTSRDSYWKASFHMNQKFYAYDQKQVPVSQWLGEATYFTRALGLLNKGWMLNVGGGVAGGYESINQDSRVIEGALIGNESNWVVGPTLAVEWEYLLTGRTILTARVQEYYLFRSSIIPTRFNVGLGIKFILPTDSAN